MKKPIKNKYVVGQEYYDVETWNASFEVKKYIYEGVVASDCSTAKCEKLLHQFRPAEYPDAESVPDELWIHYWVKDILDGPLTNLERRKAVMSQQAIDEKSKHLPVVTELDDLHVSTEITPSGSLEYCELDHRGDLEAALNRQDPICLLFKYEPTIEDLELVAQFSQNLGIYFGYNAAPKFVETLEPLSEKENLKSLCISQFPRPESTFLEMLETFSGLQVLNLFYSRISDQIGGCLIELDDLHFLDLTYTKITDWVQYDLAGLSKMDRLTLDQTRITDDFFRMEDLWPQLDSLSLKGTRLTDQGVTLLRQFTTLQDLSLDGTDITDAAIPYLTQMKNLKNLSVEKTAITIRGARELIESMENSWVRC
ncbi:Leucine Rich repeats (2 copies) [Gimesia alba]|uniref:Leucine Rich repeats (2 copies) n=1 Tax=Gimesia alba TaxID=2527973 RepID=A0A517RCH5_9PLAN|nr:hypothetical protein [Gimesia alba]QDT41591.1 Leucine Rich repeats (2 copies) [Gimesia alba]